MAGGFETFSLGQALGTAEQIKSMRRQSTLDTLRERAMQGQIAQGQQASDIAAAGEKRAATTFSQEQQIAGTKLLNAAAAEISQDPSDETVQRWLPQLDAAGVKFGANPMAVPLDVRKQFATKLFQSTSAALGALSGPQGPISVGPGTTLFDPKNRQPIYTAPKDDAITPYQRAQLGIEQSRLKIESDKAKATIDPLGLGSGQKSGAAGPSGDGLLQTLPNNIASQVKALAEGRMAFPGSFALKTPYWQQMLDLVSQYDPKFDAVNYNARSKTRNDFTSGKSAQNIKSLNTAIGHLGTLDGQIDDTASHGLTALNYLENKGAQLTGSSGPTKFKQTAGALASELTQVFRGSGGAEADVKRYLEELDVNASAEQKKAAVSNIAELLHSRLESIADQYNQGMGTSEDPLTLLNPKAQGVINRISGVSASTPGTKTATAPQASTSGPIKVNSPADAMKLPSGTQFVTPDGRIKVRP